MFKQGIKKVIVVIFSVLLAVATLQITCQGEEVIYVVGVPDEFPLGYYDEKSETYQGIIHDLLENSASNIGLDIKYIEASKNDHRLSLAKNQQVDIVCAIGLSDEELLDTGLVKGASIFTYMDNGEQKDIYFAYTSTISTMSKERLELELTNIDKNKLMDSFIRSTQEREESRLIYSVFHYIIPLLLIISVLVLFMIPLLLIKKKKQLNDIIFLDEEMGQYNYSMWKLKYTQNIKTENCQNYAVLYLQAGIENISHVYGISEATEAARIINQVCIKQVDSKSEGVTRFNEFYFIFFIRYTSIDSLKKRVESLHEAIKEEFTHQKKRYFLDINTGIYQLSHLKTKLNIILQYSKIAMEHAKQNYQSIALYNETIESETVSGYLMEHEAIRGLMQDEFIMYLQPIQDLKTGTICGAEALVRWVNPVRGLLKPGDFLNVMKRKQLTGKMNMEIYRQGCHLLKNEREKGHYPSLLFNFSPENFIDDNFVDELVVIAKQHSIDTKQMIIQLNQLVEISESKLFIVTIQKLRKYGFDVCLSGLELDKVFSEYLKYDVNYIKLRRELIQNVDNENGLKVLKSVVNLCHNLNLKTICVGIEKEEQMKILSELNCEMVTGFYFYYPVTQEVFSSLLENNN